MNKENTHVTCPNCDTVWEKEDLDRSCSNCFACTGCEAYICPRCRREIVVKPPKSFNSSNN